MKKWYFTTLEVYLGGENLNRNYLNYVPFESTSLIELNISKTSYLITREIIFKI